MKIPNLFIVGAARSGTTTLWRFLKNHNDIFMPESELLKEPAFFSTKRHHLELSGYLNIFQGAEHHHKFVGEASTAYLTDPTSAEKIYRFNPKSKIIISLRNPVERAFSLYKWMTQNGYEYASSFEKALSLENIRAKKNIPNFWEPEYYWNYMYFESGRYYPQLKRYLDLFGSQVLVLDFKAIKYDTQKIFSRLCHFLKVDSYEFSLVDYNQSHIVYHPTLQFCFRKINNFLMSFTKHLFRHQPVSKTERDTLLSLGYKRSGTHMLNEKTRNDLSDAYQSDLKKLSEIIDFQLLP